MPRLVPVLLISALSGCTTPRAVLVNDNGEHITCAATSSGLIGGIVAQTRFDNCVAAAKAKGYRIESQQK